MPARSLAALLVTGLLWQPASTATSFLNDHLLVTWYGNPRSNQMGILGEQSGAARAAALRAQAGAYASLTTKKVAMAYHLVAVVATCTPGADGMWRRRETKDIVQGLLDDARANGFRLVLDIQPGRSNLAAEVEAMIPFLSEPDVDLALDPEFAVGDCEVPGKHIGDLDAAEVNSAITRLEQLRQEKRLPPKVLIVHQFRNDMLTNKVKIRSGNGVDVVLMMDGFGSQTLKRSTYKEINRRPLAFAGVKLFYKQDTNLFSPGDVLGLKPMPSVVIYQ